MAIWQFECNIIPARSNVDKLSRDEIVSWKGISQPLLDIKFLEQEKSWSKDIIQYGKLDETCIEFIYIDDMLDEIECRLDLRRLTKTSLFLLVEYVREIDAMFLVGDMVCPPKVENILEILRNSKANKYCKDPRGYIISLNEHLAD